MFVGPYPPPYSGPELGMKQFLESELAARFRIKFLKTNFRASNADKAKIGITAAFWTLIFHLRLLRDLILFRPRVTYFPITPTAAGWLARDAPCILLCRIFGAKVVIHLRGGHLRLNFQKFHPAIQRLTRFACARATLALVQAECLRDQFEGLVPDPRIRVLPQAIDSSEYDAPGATESNSKAVVFLGNLSYAKGYCDLVRAIPIVANAVPDVKFVFCGSITEGPTGVYFDQISGRKLEHESPRSAHEAIQTGKYAANYEWRGVVHGADKLQLLRTCALVTLPSYSEGFSRALMEAMSVGKPVVCTPVGAHREFIIHDDNGLIVSPGDVNGLASAIVSLLTDDKLRARIGARNYRYTRERFGIEIVSEQLGSMLAEAANGRH